jgi:hypothetical protein
MCESPFNRTIVMEVLEIHHYPQFLDKCSDLMNMEWPRSKTMRYLFLVVYDASLFYTIFVFSYTQCIV